MMSHNLIRSLSKLTRNRIPGQLVIQMTDRCNAMCPQCGMRVTERFKRTTLSMDRIKGILDAAAAQSFQAVSFTGGEPLLNLEDLACLIRYAGKAGIPYIRTGTNGFVFQDPENPNFESRVGKIAETLADTPLRNFWISIDSYQDEIHEKMRGFSGVLRGIEKALPIFHSMGLYPSANLGITRNVGGALTRSMRSEEPHPGPSYLDDFEQVYYRAFSEFYSRIRKMGFSIVNACYPMSIHEEEMNSGLQAVYSASAIDGIVRFSREEKGRLFSSLLRAVEAHRSQIRIFSPLSALHALISGYREERHSPRAYACRGGIDFFFVDSKDGLTYPCGYRGNEAMGSLRNLDLSALGEELNANQCRRCDWECFRDPSEMLGPLMEALQSPSQLLSRWRKDPRAFQYWIQDMLYYYASDFFDGRKPLNSRRLKFCQSLFSRS